MQNRQREEFAALLSDIYPDLETNYDRVKDNRPPACLDKSVFFWHHSSEETKERSVTNEEEAIRAVNLALYLVQQGHTPNKITILATYRGQRNLIRTKMKEGVTKYAAFLPEQARIFLQPKPEKDVFDERGNKKMVAEDTTVKINTVDMYQGDENDVVIISLVRSNKKGDIGFLKEMNRRCVAQSRARCGLYFIGDVNMYRSHKTWKSLVQKLKEMNCVNEEIGLVCQDHPQIPHKVKDGNGMCLQRLKNFCEQPCGKDMECGEHLCAEKCQVMHLHSNCKARVAFTHQECEHGDTKFCHEEIRNKKCRVSIKFNFQQCGHLATRECYKSEENVSCELKHLVELPCGHPKSKRCCDDVKKIKCKEWCNQKREICQHVCRGEGGHECFKHAESKCQDCEEIEKELRIQRRKEERKLKEENEKRVKEEIKKLKKDKKALGKVWYNELNEEESIGIHHDISAKIKQYMTSASLYYPVITKIEQVFNPEMEIRFNERFLNLLKTCSSMKMFYPSTEEEIEEISKNGISLSKDEITEITEQNISLPDNGVICLTSSSTIRKTEEDEDKEKKIILSEVFLGKSKNVKDLTQENMTHCDSIFIPRNDEKPNSSDKFVLFKTDQLFPKYIVSYKLMTFKPLFEGDFNSSKKVILPQREINSEDPLQTHFSFVESRFLRMINRKNLNHEITQIEFYTNPKLERNFQKQCDEFKEKYGKLPEAEPIFGFHGTKSDGIVESIMNDNFKPSIAGKFGAGVYFSEQPNYTFGYGKHLILAKILPGKVCKLANSWSIT